MSKVMKGIRIRVIDMNNFGVEEERDIDHTDIILKPIKDYLDRLERVNGIKVDFGEVSITNREFFYGWILKEIFPDYSYEDYQTKGDNGCPDFRLFNKKDPKDYFWLEVKGDGDGLRESQIDWILESVKNKINVKVLFIKTKYPYNDEYRPYHL